MTTQHGQGQGHPPYFHPYNFTDKEFGIFVGKDGSGIKSHLKKFRRVGIKCINLSAYNNGIMISGRSHDDIMKVVGYLSIALTDMFPKNCLLDKAEMIRRKRIKKRYLTQTDKNSQNRLTQKQKQKRYS